jgi:hypothetical protein
MNLQGLARRSRAAFARVWNSRGLRRASPKRFARRRGEGGFSLVELLVAAAIVVAIAGAAAALTSPVRRAFDRGLAAADTTARARTAVSVIVSAARAAGSGLVLGPVDASLTDAVPAVAVSPATVAVTRAAGPQGLLRDAVAAGALSLQLDRSGPCTGQDDTCGIRARDNVVIADGLQAATASIASVSGESGVLYLSSPLVHAFAAGAVIAVFERTTFVLRGDRLLRLTAGGAEQPLLDHVAAFTAAIGGNRLDVLLRLESPLAATAGLELRASVGLRP